MPVFGEFETNDEPLAVTPARNQTTTVWLAKKSGSSDGRKYTIKCLAVHRDGPATSSEDALEADPGLEFIEIVKQVKKAQGEGCRDFAPILAFGTSDSGYWYATEYCTRGSLKNWINLRGGVDAAALRHVVSSLVSGCQSLKKLCGRSHGNLKPSNVLLQGKSRPLRATPLLMLDPRPVSSAQVSNLGTGDRQMMQNIFEAQDLRAIGELILQLVEGRLVEGGFDYNYPIEPSPAWKVLGKEERYWRELCNRLIDPQLHLEQTNLDWLAREHPSSFPTKKIAMAVGVLVVLGALGAGIYLHGKGGFQRHYQAASTNRDAGNLVVAAQEIQKALQIRPDDAKAIDLGTEIFKSLLGAANKEMGSRNWDAAQADVDQAAKLKPNEDLSNVSQQIQSGRSYSAAMKAGQAAFESGNYDETLKQANLALQYIPADDGAKQLKTEALNGIKAGEVETSDQREQAYDTAILAVRDALAKPDYDEAIRQADNALANKPGDADARRLRKEAQAAKEAAEAKAAADAQAKLQKYAGIMADGRDALAKGHFNDAIALANMAMDVEPDSSEAAKLKSDAEEGAQAAANAQARRGQYEQVMAAARIAFSSKNYDDAVQKGNLALGLEPNDTDAQNLINQAKAQIAILHQQQLYDAAMQQARTAFGNKNYSEAATEAKAALGIKPNDADAGNLVSQANAQLAAIQQQQAYDEAIQKARAAFGNKNYSEAANEANVALGIKPDDADAGNLLSQANTQLAIERQQQQYDDAMQKGRAAMGSKDYNEAIKQANVALEAKSGDKDATDLKNQAQLELDFSSALNLAEQNVQGNPVQAMDYVEQALKLKPNDPEALDLKNKVSASAERMKALQGLDAQLSTLMKEFDVSPSGSQVRQNPDPKVTRLPGTVDQSVLTQALTQVAGLRSDYTKSGMLDAERTKDLKKLESAISNWAQ